MKWGIRWYGAKDHIPINHIRQIPGVDGVVGTLLGKMLGDLWTLEKIKALKDSVESSGLELLGIESVAVADAIKAGTEDRDRCIKNYKQTIRNLSSCGIHLICYSFKPIFGWAKTTLFYKNPDTSYSLVYDDKVVQSLKPQDMYELIKSQSKGFEMSGWEEKWLAKIDELLEIYKGFTREKLFDNLAYFLKEVIPVCEECDVKMAIHPDEPPYEIFGLLRITKNLEDLKQIIEVVDSPYNGIMLCTGSIGSNPDNDVVQIIKEVGHRVHFVHFRNVEFLGERKFRESAHMSKDGAFDMYKIMEALVDVGFDGIIRPDYGRTIWDEECMPGYGLYDRALGICYAQGLYEAITKSKGIQK